ncbi:hypothetical protein [Pseudonocardia acaciae]|uniref:hypothetical protein n=1 Tax=Pseudonocardia acaciae TaxID=551276 RepID=UPI00068453B8|nr:hypothetical protein [Pseudonocardia acaciae]
MTFPHLEPLLAAGYAVFLLAASAGLDALARHAHHRSERYRTAGFTYHAEHDHWVCPEDQMLWPHSYDDERRLVRYRAKPHICNACPTKHRCTTSHLGREVVRPLDPWPHSEAGRFHRVVALALVALAGLLTAVELVRWHESADLIPLAASAALTAVTAWWLTGHLRATPANFPAPSPSTGLRLRGQRPNTPTGSDR